MPAERNAFKLGLTLIVFFAMTIGVLVFLSRRTGGDVKLKIRFPHDQFTTVLKPGSEVVCGGQTVGNIRSLDLQEMIDTHSGNKTLFAVITMAIDSSLGLRQDCKIVPEGLLLGGPGKLVILDRGVGEPINSGQMLDGQVAADFAGLTRLMASQLDPKDPTSLLAMVKGQLDPGDSKSLIAKIHISLEDLNAVTHSIRNEFDPRQKAVLFSKLHSILDHINDATRLLRNEMDHESDSALFSKLHETLDTLNQGLQTVVAVLKENRQPITEAVGHIRNTSQILEQQIAARIAKQLDPAEAASLIAKVHVAIDRLGSSLKDLNAITESTRETIVQNKENLNSLLVNFKETSDHLKAASKDIRRNPWRLFYQPTLDEAAQANVFDAARAFSDAATKLDDTLARLQAISQAGGQVPADDQQLKELREQLQQSFTQFTKVESALWNQLKIK